MQIVPLKVTPVIHSTVLLPGIDPTEQVYQWVWMTVDVIGGYIYNGREAWIGRVNEDEENTWKLELNSEIEKPGANDV